MGEDAKPQEPDVPAEGNEAGDKDYEINFFKPLSDHSRANMKLIMALVVIWAIAVFGFQFMLIILQKPTPETRYLTYQELAPKLEDGTAEVSDQQEMAKVILAVLGKNTAVAAKHKTMLKAALSKSMQSLLADEEKAAYQAALEGGDTVDASAMAAKAIGLGTEGFDPLMTALLPYSLLTEQAADEEVANLEPEDRTPVPDIMNLYLVHNQSALTDFRFLGFPFHYWYTAQFLLILFVVLCLVYAVLIDKIHARYGFSEE